jgi:putative ABC transport system permease protein
MSTPRWLDRLRLRLRSLTRRRSADAQLAGELALHLEEQIAENLAAGMSPEEARVAAHRAFGSVAAISDACRDTRRVAPLQNLLDDLRYGFRVLLGQPLLVLAATASIGLGVGANTLMFGLINELLFAPPTAHDPEQLVNVRLSNSSHVSHGEWRRLNESGALAGFTGYNVEVSVNWRDGDRTVTIVPLIVTSNFFELLGTPMALGRGFSDVEAAAEREPRVAVISHGFWQRLGSSPSAVGRTLIVNGQPYTVLGVLPSGLRSIVGFGLAPDIYLPQSASLNPDLHEEYGASVQLVGRLRDGQALEQGIAAVNTIVQRRPDGSRDDKRRVTQFSRVTDGLAELRSEKMFFLVVLIVSSLVLAIACANVAGLNLARSATRRREIAVRLALGATRMRLVQQLLVESFWLTLAGTAGGLLLMATAMQLISRIPLPLPLPLELRAPIDARMGLYTLLLVVLATLFSGLVPALQATRRSLTPALKLESTHYLHRRWTLRGLLVTGQVAVSMVLLVTSFLFLRNLAHASTASPGFDTRQTLVALVSFVERQHTVAGRLALLHTAAARIEALPGFERASFSLGIPLTVRNGRTSGSPVWIEGEGEKSAQRAWWSENMVGPGYFEALDIPLRAGRDFRITDDVGAPRSIVVNDEFVRRYLAGHRPLGLRMMLQGADRHEAWAIVGVVANGKYRTLGEEQMPAIYFPYAQRPTGGRVVHVIARTASTGEAAIAGMTRAIGDLDRTAAVDVRTMRDTLAFAFLPSQMGAALLGSMGAMGLTLAAAGLFALLTYSVTQRSREIGVRMALGASTRSVARLVFVDAAVLVGVGIVIGLAASAFVTKPLAMFLVAGLSTSDPASFGSTVVLFALVSAAATWIPIRRAMRVDPVVALRDS